MELEQSEQEQSSPKRESEQTTPVESEPSSSSATEGEAPKGKLSVLEDRLFKLRMKINQGRKANKEEVEEEYKRATGRGRAPQGEEDEEGEHSNKNSKKAKAKKNELTEEQLLNQTAEEASWVAEKNREKAETVATFGLNAFTDDQYHRSYEKRIRKLPSTAKPVDSGEQQLATAETTADGKPKAAVSDAALEKLRRDILEREEQRKKFGKRRLHVDGDVDYINDKNAKFNKKLERAFDKYTVEIRQNLERGTAL